jgi:hypothetical protein
MRPFLPRDVEPKDPQESKIYTMDWTAALNGGATISSSTWTLDPGITNAGASIVSGSKKTSIEISGGVAGVDYHVTNQIVTSDGETLERTGILRVRNR